MINGFVSNIFNFDYASKNVSKFISIILINFQ